MAREVEKGVERGLLGEGFRLAWWAVALLKEPA